MSGSPRMAVGSARIERTVTFYRTQGVRIIDFEIAIEATAGPSPSATPRKGCSGCGWRRIDGREQDDKKGGKITNAEGLTDDPAWGKASPWVDYVGPVKDQTVGIAILNHPSSFRFPDDLARPRLRPLRRQSVRLEGFRQARAGAITPCPQASRCASPTGSSSTRETPPRWGRPDTSRRILTRRSWKCVRTKCLRTIPGGRASRRAASGGGSDGASPHRFARLRLGVRCGLVPTWRSQHGHPAPRGRPPETTQEATHRGQAPPPPCGQDRPPAARAARGGDRIGDQDPPAGTRGPARSACPRTSNSRRRSSPRWSCRASPWPTPL